MENPNHKFIRVSASGDIEEIDLHTGEVRIKTENAYLLETLKNEYVKVFDDANKEVIWVPKLLPPTIIQAKTIKYSTLLADKIADLVAEGHSFNSICRRGDMPSIATLREWRRLHPDFEEKLQLARQDRAETYIDKAENIIEKVVAETDEIAKARLQSDFYKYMAKISNPREYQETTKVEGKIAVGYAAIETGIRRPGDPGFLKDERLREVDSGEGKIGKDEG